MSEDVELKQLEVLMKCKEEGTDINKYIDDLKQLQEEVENNQDFIDLLKIFKALADKTRFLIFQLLVHKEEMCICEFQVLTDLKQPTISHHVQKLEEIDLIEGIKRGKFIHYRLKNSSILEYLKLIKKISNLKNE